VIRTRRTSLHGCIGPTHRYGVPAKPFRWPRRHPKVQHDILEL